jgi:hypothetical protein
VRAVYGPKYPTSDYTFAVITRHFNVSTIKIQGTEDCAQAIVYIRPDSFAEWKLLAEGKLADRRKRLWRLCMVRCRSRLMW